MNISTFLYAVIIYASVIAISPSATSSTKPPPPAIEYSCMSNGSVSINVTNFGKQGFYMIGSNVSKTVNISLTSSGGQCVVPITNISETIILVNSTNCFSENLQDVKCYSPFNQEGRLDASCLDGPYYVDRYYVDRHGKSCVRDTFYLYLMEETLSKKILGGNKFYEYELSCKIPDEGIQKTVFVATIRPHVPPDFNKGNANFHDVDVTMTVDNPSPTIGDKVKITITETGSTGHYILPVNCSAIGGDDKEQIALMNNGSSNDHDLMTNFTVSTKGNATASLFAFRFMTTDIVKLECVVVVCNTKNCTSGYSRRRRSVNGGEERDTFEVSAEYKITDVTSGKPRDGYSLLTVISLVLTSMFASMKTF